MQLLEDATYVNHLIKNEFFVPFAKQLIYKTLFPIYWKIVLDCIYGKFLMFWFLSIRFGLNISQKWTLVWTLTIYGVNVTPLLKLLKMWLKSFIFFSKVLSRSSKCRFRDPGFKNNYTPLPHPPFCRTWTAQFPHLYLKL